MESSEDSVNDAYLAFLDNTEVWNAGNIGQEWKQNIPNNKQLIETHKNYIHSLEQKHSKKLENIVWKHPIGAGAFGNIWKVEAIKWNGEQYENMELACKVIRFQDYQIFGNLKQAVNKLLGDYLVLRKLEHVNICKLIQCNSIPDSETGFPFAAVCLFMELCDGNLEQLIRGYDPNNRKSHLPEELCRIWFKQIVYALKYLHDLQVVHLDISPKNILYSLTFELNPISGPQESRTPLETVNYMVRNSIFKLGVFGNSKWKNIYDLEINAEKGIDIDDLGNALFHSIAGMSEMLTSGQSANGLQQKYELTDNVWDLIKGMTTWSLNDRLRIDDILQHNWVTD